MLQNFTFPHSHSANWEQLEVICQEECAELVAHIGEVISDGEAAVVDIKPLIMKVGDAPDRIFLPSGVNNYMYGSCTAVCVRKLFTVRPQYVILHFKI